MASVRQFRTCLPANYSNKSSYSRGLSLQLIIVVHGVSGRILTAFCKIIVSISLRFEHA